MEKAESMRRSQNEFLSGLSRELKMPMRDVLALDERIIRESGEDHVRDYASRIRSISSRLVSLIEGVLDSSESDPDTYVQTQETFSLGWLITDILQTAHHLAEDRQVELKADIAEMIPDRVQGDPSRLREIIMNLLSDALLSPGAGQVCLSVYGKTLETKVHLLVSVRTAKPVPPSGTASLQENAKDEGTGLGREIAAKLLVLLGSGLKSVPPVDGWSETYFETELLIMDNAPVGRLNLSEARS
jgi:signal transduction histidine kinase